LYLRISKAWKVLNGVYIFVKLFQDDTTLSLPPWRELEGGLTAERNGKLNLSHNPE